MVNEGDSAEFDRIWKAIVDEFAFESEVSFVLEEALAFVAWPRVVLFPRLERIRLAWEEVRWRVSAAWDVLRRGYDPDRIFGGSS